MAPDVKEARPEEEPPLTIAEAKRRLSKTRGVPSEKIKIIVEG
jgi:hypothetical protein